MTFIGLVSASLSTFVSLLLAIQDEPASMASPLDSPRLSRPPLSPMLALPEQHRLHAPDLRLAPLLPAGVVLTGPVALLALYDLLIADTVDVHHATQWLLPFGVCVMALATRRMIEGSQSEVCPLASWACPDDAQLQSLERLKYATVQLRTR